jgi:hypothetical protein
MTHSPLSHSAKAGLDAHASNSYHDSTSHFYSHNNNSVASSSSSSSSSLNPPNPPPRTKQPQNPQGHSPDSNTVVQPTGATTSQGPVSDAWAEHGHFPLSLDSVSRRTVPVRGGSTILLTGDNFRGKLNKKGSLKSKIDKTSRRNNNTFTRSALTLLSLPSFYG